MSETEIVTVIERIPLKPEFASSEGAESAGQAYDDAVGANAHVQCGHTGVHAVFFFEAGPSPGTGHLVLLYPWYGREAIAALLNSETALLECWLRNYAAGPRQVSVLTEIPVSTGQDR
jgi:hypothetical protein